MSVLRRLAGVPNDVALAADGTSKLTQRLWDVFLRTFDLGFTAFGGPPVHFQIFHTRFVDGLGKTPWIDEQTYQELFALSQALPGPASTKMLFNIAQIHAGVVPAIFVFLLWSLPAGIAMYGFALGVRRINEVLPGPVYALLSGLNAATVGIIALASVQLSRKAITDPWTRLLVTIGACAGLCYNALWYFPVLLVIAGITTVIWDFWGRPVIVQVKNRLQNRGRQRRSDNEAVEEEGRREGPTEGTDIPLEDLKTDTEEPASSEKEGPHRRPVVSTASASSHTSAPPSPVDTHGRTVPPAATQSPQPTSRVDISAFSIPVKVGVSMIIFFFSIFAVIVALRGSLKSPPLALSLFSNMFLAGTIIFGGGPVVIPLLRDYVVDPGWVSPRDFLLGLAVIQAMPGPNFNFAIYLGTLALNGANPKLDALGGVLGFLGIFFPGLWLSIGFQSVWTKLRKNRQTQSLLRGVNAAAVGFVYTAVYRLWEIGYLTPEATNGISLGQEPWWLVIAASTFTAVEWFFVPPPVAILTGGVAGVAWWGAVGRHAGK